MKRVLFRSFFHNLSAMGRLAVPGDGAGNESWTLELVAAEMPGGADAQGDLVQGVLLSSCGPPG